VKRTLAAVGIAVMVLLAGCGNVPHVPGKTDGNRQIAAEAVTR
jgi:uncharacterized protein YceK